MTNAGLPSFAHRSALVIHRRDQNYDALSRQLSRIGLAVEHLPPNERTIAIQADFAFFDVDACHSDLFPWRAGASPIPLIGILGSEAPGALERALAHLPSAFMQKPIASTGVYNILVIADHNHTTRQKNEAYVETLKERIKARPIVFRAVLHLMQELRVSDGEAFQALRSLAMSQRLSVELLATKIISGDASDSRLLRKGRRTATAHLGPVPRPTYQNATSKRG